MKLTENEKRERLKRSVDAWLNASDVPSKNQERALWLLGRWAHESGRWFLKVWSYREGER